MKPIRIDKSLIFDDNEDRPIGNEDLDFYVLRALKKIRKRKKIK